MKKDWLKKCDFLNIPTSISYKNEYFYATKVGAVLTILFFFIIIGLFTYQIIILSNKASFTLITNQYTDLTQIIDFSKTPFLFQLTDDMGKVLDIDKKLLHIEAYNMQLEIKYENGTQKKALTNTKIDLVNCDQLNLIEKEYSNLNLSKFICIAPGQNLTSFGIIGDINSPFKSIRIYINRCQGSDCYNKSVIDQKLHNSKFLVTYLTLSTNIFYLRNQNLKYQLFTKTCSLSPNLLKKFVFTYDKGIFELYNSPFLYKKVTFDYLIGNDYIVNIDLDPTSTMKKDEATIAYISFNFGGNVIETRKQVQTFLDSLSIIGNIFNILLTIVKIINNYYSNKILFVDIFDSVFFEKENKSFNNKENINMKNFTTKKKINNNLIKNKLDLSNEICLNNNNLNNKDKSIKSFSKKKMLPNYKHSLEMKNTKIIVHKVENIFNSSNKLMYYYLLPFWVLRKKKEFNYLYIIKDRICKYFSIEKINELIKFKKTLEDKSKKSKINYTELININKGNNFEKIE